MTSTKYIPFDWILLFTRAVLAAVMIYYGWPKIRDLGSNANDFVQMGFKPGMFWGTLIAAVEFFGGIAILLGFYAELAAALFAFQRMVGTFWKLKVRKPFSDYSYITNVLDRVRAKISPGINLGSGTGPLAVTLKKVLPMSPVRLSPVCTPTRGEGKTELCKTR